MPTGQLPLMKIKLTICSVESVKPVYFVGINLILKC